MELYYDDKNLNRDLMDVNFLTGDRINPEKLYFIIL